MAKFDFEFIGVGRGRRDWKHTFDFPRGEVDLNVVARHIAKSGAIMSKGVDVDGELHDDGSGEATIQVGWNVVGRVKWKRA